MAKRRVYRVYRASNPPFSGGKEYFDVKNQSEAIKKVKALNKKAKKKDWVWAQTFRGILVLRTRIIWDNRFALRGSSKFASQTSVIPLLEPSGRVYKVVCFLWVCHVVDDFVA